MPCRAGHGRGEKKRIRLTDAQVARFGEQGFLELDRLTSEAVVLALQDVSVKSVVQKGMRDQARLVMVVHPVLESRFAAAMELIAGLEIMRAPPRAIRVIEEEFG